MELDSAFRNVSGFGLNKTSKFQPKDMILLFANTSTPDLMSVWFPTHWTQEAKRRYGENDETPPNSTEV
jgi:hypothetical protein